VPQGEHTLRTASVGSPPKTTCGYNIEAILQQSRPALMSPAGSQISSGAGAAPIELLHRLLN